MSTKAAKPSDYKHIAAWGRQLGSFSYYITREQEKAFAAGAPINAIYQKSGPGGTETGVWVTADEIVSEQTREQVNREAERLKQARA